MCAVLQFCARKEIMQCFRDFRFVLQCGCLFWNMIGERVLSLYDFYLFFFSNI